MFVTTFYSFKGGVGRTLALMNVASELAKNGKRVLMVDFDLEAPGLDTINPSPASGVAPGVVEFVDQYVRTGIVPDASDFIYPVVDHQVDGELWLMPAGRQDEAYAPRLAGIDWQDLYENLDGFLMFEELKVQWRKRLRFDYVLIDSRTGHTDVTGICTRHLPDAVAMLFFPNEQNLRGIKQIVATIREEPQSSGRSPIDVVYVASNVPYLDDEESILRRRLAAFRKQLAVAAPLVTINHYDSLTLIERPLITRDRPQTRLAKQYRALAARIRSLNAGDREGAIALLEQYERPHSRLALNELHRRLDQIQSAHLADGEILYHVGRIRSDLGQISSAVSLFEEARRMGFARPELNLALAEAYQRHGAVELVGESVRRVLYDSAADFAQVWKAIELVRVTDPDSLEDVVGSAAVAALASEARASLAEELDRSHAERAAAAYILHSLIQNADDSDRWVTHARFSLSLALMALGQLPAAKDLLQQYVRHTGGNTASSFNLAMAEWGIAGEPSPDLFRRALPAIPADDVNALAGANYQQCIAVAYWVLGDVPAAEQHLDLARAAIKMRYTPEFSCWNYLRVEPDKFAQHLDALGELFRGSARMPEFFDQYRTATRRG